MILISSSFRVNIFIKI